MNPNLSQFWFGIAQSFIGLTMQSIKRKQLKTNKLQTNHKTPSIFIYL